ncbi:methyltransferase [Phellopilus nigrolimitatus]|nr:methyltransferase [Phellopilus nigrolimitatus]
MATAAEPTPHDVSTSLKYYAPKGDEAPFQYVLDPPAGTPKDNLGWDTRPAVIHDVRGSEDAVSLDTTGFQFVRHASAERDFRDEERITTVYYSEVEALLKRETGAKRVVVFGHTIRRNYADSPEENASGVQGPAEAVHVDQTFDASVARVHRHLGAEAARLLQSRVRIVNVWRPIEHAVAHKPLALADWRTLDVARDLVSVRLIYPDRVGALFAVRHNPALRWHFLNGQTPDEVALIKIYDSDVDKARLAPHTAFLDETSPASAPKRQSVEVRALVFDDE